MRRVAQVTSPMFMVVDSRIGSAPPDYHPTALGAYEDLALTLMLRGDRFWPSSGDEVYFDKVLNRLARWLMWVDTK